MFSKHYRPFSGHCGWGHCRQFSKHYKFPGHCGWSKTTFGNKSETLTYQGGVYRGYQQWCEWVEADKHGYNYWEPKYNLGRAPVARCNITSYEEFNKIWTDTPWISKVELID